MVRTIFFCSVASLAVAAALAEEPDAATPAEIVDDAVAGADLQSAPAEVPVGAQQLMAPESAPAPAGDAHGAAAAAPVGASDELDDLNQGAAEEFPDMNDEPVRKPVSVTLRALDKITARYKDLTAKINEAVTFGSLEITPRYCDKRPPEDFPETTAFLEVFDRDLSRARAASSVEVREEAPKPKSRKERKKTTAAAPGASAPMSASSSAVSDLPSALDPDRIFAGWMFASSPALNALEHPVYDVWVIDCKTVAVAN